MAQVGCQEIRKSFGPDLVLDNVNLTVNSGEFMVLLGPSGCGKSTLLRIIAGIEQQDSGSVTIDEKVVDNVHPRERDLAMVFQNYALYPLMSIFDNLAFSQRIRKVAESDISKRVQEVADILGLVEHLDKKPSALSGGQRQRVAMGRAMMRNPRVFLFDEPLSNLDARLRAKMRTRIKSLHISLNTTTLYVTHDQIEAMTMGDRIAVMRNSVIEQLGTPEEIYGQPQSLHVATFIGSPEINVLEASIQGGTCRMGELELPMPHAAPDGPVHYCVRPHDMALAAPGTPNALPARLEMLEPTGNQAIVHANLQGKVTLQIQIAADEVGTLGSGENLAVNINPTKVHLFDPGNQRRITPT